MKRIIYNSLLIFALLCNYLLVGQTALHDTIIELSGGYSIVRIYADNGFFSDYLAKGDASDLDITTGMATVSELTENEDDVLGGTLWLPDTTSGVLPMDVLYNDTEDKFYYFGNRRLMIIDAFTDYAIKSITVSSYANIFAIQASWTNPYSNFLAYNPNSNTVYCATFGNELLFIDGQTDEISQTFTEYSMGDQLSTNIVFNETTNRLYWLINSWTQAKIRMFDFNTLQQYEYTISEQIGDMVCDSEGDYLYISTSSSVKTLDAANLLVNQSYATEKTGVLLYDNYNSTLYCQVNTDGPAPGNLYYFNHQGQYLGTLTTGLTFVSEKAYRKENTSNTTDSKIYFSGVTNSSYVIKVINGTTHEISTIYPGTTYFGMVFNQTSDKLYCGGDNKIASYSGSSNALVDQSTLKGCTSRKLEFIPENTTQIVSLNTQEGTICSINENCQPSHFRSIGMCSYKGCYNEENNYAYFAQSESKYDDGIISVYDNNNAWVKTIGQVGKNITSIVYNKETNRIFVACYDDGVVTVINGSTNTVFTKINFLSPNRSIYPRILLSYGDYVYVGGYGGIAVIDAYSCSWQDLGSTCDCIPTDIDKDEEHASVYITYAMGDSYVYKIDHTPPAFEITGSAGLGGANPVGVRYHPLNDKLYVANISSMNVYVFNKDLVQQATIQFNYPLKYIEKDTYRNRVYALGYYVTNGYIPEINITNNSLVSTYVTNRSEGLIYNPVSDRVQTSGWYEEFGKDVSVNTIDCYDNSFNSTQSGNKLAGFAFINSSMLSRNDPFFNQTKNLMYFGNNGFSNASVIQCNNDILPLKQDITWLSFPRMERLDDLPTPTDPVLMRNSWYPQVGFDLLGRIPDYPYSFEHRYYYPPNWTGNLTNLKSTFGYKLDFTGMGIAKPVIKLNGAILDPETHMTLRGQGVENWFGYFLPTSQWAIDAIPSNIFNHYLISITTQYWSKTKIGGIWVGSGKETPLKYGDLVILRTNYSGDLDFWWNNPTEAATDVEVPNPQNFTFEEKLDYVPVYIYTDAESEIAEIGAVVNGECIGATVRNPGDTIVEVDTYLYDVPPGSSVEFVTWDGFKSSATGKNGYVVFNPNTGKMEKRTIYAGERQDYYLASLRRNDPYIIPGDVSDLQCNPNPVSGKALISFRVNEAVSVSISINDLNGKEVIRLNGGEMQGGYYNREWDTSQLQPGIYMLSLHTSGGTLMNKKIAVIK